MQAPTHHYEVTRRLAPKPLAYVELVNHAIFNLGLGRVHLGLGRPAGPETMALDDLWTIASNICWASIELAFTAQDIDASILDDQGTLAVIRIAYMRLIQNIPANIRECLSRKEQLLLIAMGPDWVKAACDPDILNYLKNRMQDGLDLSGEPYYF